MSGLLRILIIDDHDDVRHALTARLNSAPGMTVVGETADAEDGLLKTRTLRPEVVVVETKRTDGRGLEIVSWIAQSGIGACVIVLTSYPSEWERWAAHRAGAARYLLKDIGSPLLIEHIRRAAASLSSHDYDHSHPTSTH
jgi:two-component system response regulator DevR